MKEVTYDLPSRGFLEVSQVARVVTREYRVEEEKGLFSSNRPFQKLLNLVSSTIVWAADAAGQEIDPKQVVITDWPHADFIHALCQLRAVSDQPEFEFTLPCPNCKNPVPFLVDLTPEGLDTVYLSEEDSSVEYSGETSMGLLTCRHVLVKNHLTLDNILKKRKQKAGRNWDGGYSLRIANQLVGIQAEYPEGATEEEKKKIFSGKFPNITEAESWLMRRLKRERVEITDLFQEYSFGDDLSLPLECDSCGYLDTAMMPITDKEFLFRESSLEKKRRRS